MLWLIVTISAYFILAVVFLVDKYLLVGPIPSPKVYAFYIGILQALALLLIPFVNFIFPGFFYVFLGLASGFFFIIGLLWFYKGLRIFEASRIVPAIGGLLPIFTFFLIYVFSGGKEILGPWEFLSFLLLISGSFIITSKKGKKIPWESLKISAVAASTLSFYMVLAKYVYMVQPFWSGFIWIRIGALLAGIVLLFLFFKEIKEEVFKKREASSLKTTLIFLSNQTAGAGANILQNWAVALAPLVYVSVVNALMGTQYAFLFIFALVISLKFPKILKEEVSREVFFQKIAAILLIGGGLAILAFK